MIGNIIYFLIGVVVPVIGEEYAYNKFIPKASQQAGNQSYGWRLLWDAAYFFVVVATGYRIIFAEAALSLTEWLGYAIFISGIALRIWALKELGQFYSPVIALKAEHQIINSGPYRTFRHPLHTGTFLKISGLAFLSPLWLAIPSALIALVLGLVSSRIEDQLHLKHFGEPFRKFYLSTWDLIDLIYWKK